MLVPQPAAVSDPTLRAVAELSEHGWCVYDDFISDALVETLREEAYRRWSGGAFHAAGVGSGALHRHDEQVRGDEVLWLEEKGSTEAQRACLMYFEELRLALNRELQLGLFEFECHFARYQTGSAYGRHLDQFAENGGRLLSCVLYLNEGWLPAHLGELRLHLQDRHVDLAPVGGRLVCFFSARFEHEVLPPRRQRLSLTGWFRQRT
jgi:SM-20-related protein